MATISAEDLPALFRDADRSSLASQSRYMRLVRGDLALIVGGAVVTAWATAAEQLRVALAISGAIALMAGLVLTAFVLQTKPDKLWFGARAVAESVKTMAWRYMMCAEPYLRSLPGSEADALFSQELQAILDDRNAIGAVLGGVGATGEQIKDAMREMRSADLERRKRVYLTDRIRDQRSWYGRKAQTNGRSSTFWLVAVGVSQLAAAVGAVAMVRWPAFQFNVPAVFASLAAAFMAWLQVKQHQELAHAYGLAAHELGVIEIRARHLSTEDDFSSFVADAENAISREHTMWVARRDVVA